MKDFKVAVFGKQGCKKCDLLKKRLLKILAEDTFADFEMQYYDLGTVDGLVSFCQCEILNPQRIPSTIIYERVLKEEKECWQPIRVLKKISRLPDSEFESFLGLETDYKSTGVIAPAKIKELLEQARQNVMIKSC